MRRGDRLRLEPTDWNDLTRLGDRDTSRRGHQRVEVTCGAPVPQVPQLIRACGVDERDVGANRLLEHMADSVDEALLLALGEQGPRADRRVEGPDAGAA